MRIELVTEAQLPLVAALVAEQQSDPERHICYLGFTPEDVATELRGLEPLGLGGVLVAQDGDLLLGVIGVRWADAPPRAWWQGPYVFDRADDPAAVADALLAAGRRLLPPTVTQQELGPDERNTLIAALARRSGFEADEASVVLNRQAQDGHAQNSGGAAISAFTEEDRSDVAALHDNAFAGAHLVGTDIDEGDRRIVLVARDPSTRRLAGYVAADAEVDGSGYIDFVAVEAGARDQGVGAALVEAACAALRERFGYDTVNLTVRESNAPARALYAKLGFTEERLIRPWRIGFTLGRAAPLAAS